MTLTWQSGRTADTALFMLGGLTPIQLRAEDDAWSVRSVDGRRRWGDASSRGAAKRECLRAIEDVLKTGMADVSEAFSALGT